VCCELSLGNLFPQPEEGRLNSLPACRAHGSSEYLAGLGMYGTRPPVCGSSRQGAGGSPVQGKWLRQVITGHFAYYAVPANGRALSAFRYYVTDLWRRTLRRRSQRGGFTWDRMTKLADDWLPQPRILHPWPQQRFAVTHPR
jgi:hypothetical protein